MLFAQYLQAVLQCYFTRYLIRTIEISMSFAEFHNNLAPKILFLAVKALLYTVYTGMFNHTKFKVVKANLPLPELTSFI